MNGTVGGRTSGETLIGAEGARLYCSISQAKGQKVTNNTKRGFLSFFYFVTYFQKSSIKMTFFFFGTFIQLYILGELICYLLLN
ncbi:hypothetical protein SI82_04525 [Streptococcus iniae]|uniref:Uncharacterized protein n=1 Tax=Streptococcus iniae TaxID=1346 RepID=A0ABM5QH67_STRIN|nr:hypothetical protein DQ08_04310 [Streptococcus iniae]AJG25860.1 hypothetical protein SI82_04525 [Streptococcus iniae]ESR10756.1 hypothetical protein IUSA1_00155 [Streptococcus iniae IUSA1]